MAYGIIIDARKLGDGGIGVYLENLVYGLLTLPQYLSGQFRLTLLVTPEFIKGGESLDPDLRKARKDWENRVLFVSEPAPRYSREEYFDLARRQRELLLSHHLFHSPHYTLPFFLGLPSIVTIHDVIHVSCPDTFLHRILGRILIRSAIKRATHVLTVSQSSAREIRKLSLLDESQISVVPNALRFSFALELSHVGSRSEDASTRSKKYIFVGSDRPHKGFGLLVEAWEMFTREMANAGQSAPELAVVGQDFSEKTKNLVRMKGLERQITFVGPLETPQLVHLYNEARALIVPSLEEGFGLTGLEAISSGIPFIAFPVPSLREVCGEAGWFARDFSSSALSDVLLAFEKSPAMEALKVRYGKRLSGYYSVENFARGIQGVYERVLVDSGVMELRDITSDEVEQSMIGGQ